MARSVEDLALAYRVIAGADGHDLDVPPVAVGDMERVEIRGLRVAFAPTFPGVPVSAAIRGALVRVASELERAGAALEEALPDVDFREIARARPHLSRVVDFEQLANASADHLLATRGLSPGGGHEPPPSMADYLAALDVRDRITGLWEAFFGEWDVLLCPVSMTTAFPHCPVDTPLQVDGETVNYWRAVGHTAPFNFTGHPSVAVPIGRDPDGLPIGAQVVGKRWEEERLLGAAARVAEVADYS
jgi:amidase